MNYFNIKDTLENVAKLNFREDEIKYLGKSNKFFKNLFSDKEITKENVERYLYEYFDKIEKADFPLLLRSCRSISRDFVFTLCSTLGRHIVTCLCS